MAITKGGNDNDPIVEKRETFGSRAKNATNNQECVSLLAHLLYLVGNYGDDKVLEEVVDWIDSDLKENPEIDQTATLSFISSLVNSDNKNILKRLFNDLTDEWFKDLGPEKAKELCMLLVGYAINNNDKKQGNIRDWIIDILFSLIPESIDTIKVSPFGLDEKFELIKEMFSKVEV